MALDFGDAGLFDPLTPQNGKKSTNGTNKRFDFEKDQDDENDNIHSNGWGNGDKESIGGGGSDEDEDKEDMDELESWPSAPPLDILDCIKGYEMVSFDTSCVPPPPFEEDSDDSDVEIKKEVIGEGCPNEGEDQGAAEDGGGGGGAAQDGSAASEKNKVSSLPLLGVLSCASN